MSNFPLMKKDNPALILTVVPFSFLLPRKRVSGHVSDVSTPLQLLEAVLQVSMAQEQV